ncbi:MAG: recombination protein RecR [Clostridia bacterium]|nr:recombination protein RecR [Clostridia bacterium]
MAEYAKVFGRLVNAFSKMPNIGSKTAEKMAYYVLDLPQAQCDELVQLIEAVRSEMHFCSICGSMTDEDPCRICTSMIRRKDVLCVVKDARDVTALERIKCHDGLYHVLGGLISPIDGVRPSDIRIKELVERVEAGSFKEVILALSPNAEGETTTLYIAKLLKPLGVTVTRIAHGIPAGGELEYADDVTLSGALNNRREL